MERRASVNTACGQPDPSGVEARSRHLRGDGAVGVDANDEAGGCAFASAAGAERSEVAENGRQRLPRRFDDGGGEGARDAVAAPGASEPRPGSQHRAAGGTTSIA